MYWAVYRDGYRRCFMGESPEVFIPPIHHSNKNLNVERGNIAEAQSLTSLEKHALMGREKFFKPKRKLSAWQKFVKANSKKPKFRYKSGAKKGKLNLKAMGVAYRKKKR